MLVVDVHGHPARVMKVSPGAASIDPRGEKVDDLVTFDFGDGWWGIRYDDLMRIAEAASKARGMGIALGDAEGVVVGLRSGFYEVVDLTLHLANEDAQKVREHLHLGQRVGVRFVAEAKDGADSDADRAGRKG